jgi:3-methyladenine DNA glycosylase AlkD
MRRMDRINNWDLVDVSCPFVSGYLYDRPRDVLYEMARSESLWERRTAIVSTYYFIRQGDLDDTFKIAEVLLGEDEDVIHKAAGGWLRAAGEKDVRRLRYFLDEHAATMPRTMLRYAIEHLDKKERKQYMDMKRAVDRQ